MRVPLAFVLVVLAAAVAAGGARANGDPASDVLPFSRVFLSLQDPKRSPAGQELLAVTAAAKDRKYPIRVAVIAQPTDLGLIQSLWRKPQPYAVFLGKELIQFGRYHGTLVVAMPNGFGVFGPGATARGKRALAKLPAPTTRDLEHVGEDTATAVRRVAAANGHPLPASSSDDGSGTPSWVIVLAAAVGAGLVAGAAFLALRRWLLRA